MTVIIYSPHPCGGGNLCPFYPPRHCRGLSFLRSLPLTCWGHRINKKCHCEEAEGRRGNLNPNSYSFLLAPYSLPQNPLPYQAIFAVFILIFDLFMLFSAHNCLIDKCGFLLKNAVLAGLDRARCSGALFNAPQNINNSIYERTKDGHHRRTDRTQE